ncbi:MAG: plasmid replication protein RepC, partial [Acetobacteraceae bacterium]
MDSGLDGEHNSAARQRCATGLRRLTAPMLTADQLAARFEGTEASPGQILAAFKAAAAHLGITPRAVHAVDWLFRFTQPQDWQPEQRPIVWPSAGLQQEALGLGPAQVKNLNRHLIELGVITAKDSPNGKRYGRRDKAGNIVLAYGFDLSPLAVRLEEFREAAERARAERAALRDLRRRLTIARNSLRQTFETVREYRLTDTAWTTVETTVATAGPIRV